MTFNFDAEVDIDFDFNYIELYREAVLTVLNVEKCPFESTVSLMLVDDNTIKDINNSERNIDKSTDVLSFPMNTIIPPADFSSIEDDIDAFDPDTGEMLLGDIVLSKDHIISQSYEYGHSIEREYVFLIVHSMLHLIGYDHIEEDDRIIMENRQKEIMDILSKAYPVLKVN